MIDIKKEFLIFIVLFIVSSIAVHNSIWFSAPIEHFNALFSHGMPYHPFLYTFIIYIILGFARGLLKIFKKLFSKG